MITYQVECIDDVRAEIEPMLRAHYEEIATDKDIKPLDIDWDRYYDMEDRGMVRILTARDHVGSLVGYFVTFIHRHLHYRQTVTALNDILYVDPEYRGGTTAYRLFKAAIDDVRNLGADILIIHMKVEYPFRDLLSGLGFHLTEENWELPLRG